MVNLKYDISLEMTPCGEVTFAQSMLDAIKNHVNVHMFKDMSIKDIFDEVIQSLKHGYNRYQYCVCVQNTGTINIYINFWERDTKEQWGSRLFEIQISLKNAFNPDEYPELTRQCIRKFNDASYKNLEDDTITEISYKLLDFAIQDEIQNATVNDPVGNMF